LVWIRNWFVWFIQSFTIDFTLNQKWFDTRLNVNFTNLDNLILDHSFVSKLWTPDIYFQNALSASVVNAFQAIQFITIGRYNNITYTTRMNGKFVCKMDLSNYPQDYQYCGIEIVSRKSRIIFWRKW